MVLFLLISRSTTRINVKNGVETNLQKVLWSSMFDRMNVCSTCLFFSSPFTELFFDWSQLKVSFLTIPFRGYSSILRQLEHRQFSWHM